MAASIPFQSQQNQSIAIAVAAGQSITISSMNVGGGYVWPFLLANGVPIFRGQLSPHQVRAIIDNAVAGKTAAVNFNSGTGKNYMDFS